MLYVFYGRDNFSVQEKFHRLQESSVADDVFETNITKFHVSSTSPNQIEEICNTIPFLGSKRLVVVEGLLSIFERSNPRSSQGKNTEESLSGWITMIEYLKIFQYSYERHLPCTNIFSSAISILSHTIDKYN